MNARPWMDALALAAYKLAEAETRERQAAKMRLAAAKILAALHLELSDALKLAESRQCQTSPASKNAVTSGLPSAPSSRRNAPAARSAPST